MMLSNNSPRISITDLLGQKKNNCIFPVINANVRTHYIISFKLFCINFTSDESTDLCVFFTVKMEILFMNFPEKTFPFLHNCSTMQQQQKSHENVNQLVTLTLKLWSSAYLKFEFHDFSLNFSARLCLQSDQQQQKRTVSITNIMFGWRQTIQFD